MPFTSVNDLPPNPDVRIFFVGQLILDPLLGSTGCEVFINRSAPHHQLSIEVRRKRPNRPDEIMMRQLDPLPFALPPQGGQQRHGMFIRAVPNPTGVTAYNGSNTSSEGEELNLALNMFRIHDVPTGPVEPIGGRPSILVEQAIFYTADTYPAGATLTKKRPGSLPKPQPKFASVIGANIYLAEGQRAQISWRPDRRDALLNLPKTANQSFEIYICNEPAFQDDSPQAPFAHDELSEYYKILRNIPLDEQFVLKTPAPNQGSLRTPCMSVLLSQ